MGNVNSFTVVSVVEKGSVPKKFVCATDTGTILEYPVEGKQGMLSLLKWHPEMVRNLTMQQMNSSYVMFPKEVEGTVAGTIVCTGVRDSERLFRVVYKSDGVWCAKDLDEEETVSRIKKGLIAKAEVHGNKVSCKAPVKQELFESSDVTTKQKRGMGKQLSTALLYVTEASDENSNVMRYAGVEFSGSPEMIESMKEGLNAQSLLFREAYYNMFGRKDTELGMLFTKDKLFVVLPYQSVESLLLGGKQTVQVTRVIVSSVAFRSGCIFDESKVVISGCIGCGEIRGSGGTCDNSVRKLIKDVQGTLKTYTNIQVAKKTEQKKRKTQSQARN